jgi:membrane protease YdiL (CAAX protease family)
MDSEQTLSPRKAAVYTIVFFSIMVLSIDILHAIPGYTDWLSQQAKVIRWLEGSVLALALVFVGLKTMLGLNIKEMAEELGLMNNPGMPLVVAFTACTPMMFIGAFGGLNEGLHFLDALFGSVIWPFNEELVFRGFAFLLLYRRAQWGFWQTAIGLGLIFGLLHLGNASIKDHDLAGEIGAVLIVSLGGILFAWLMVRWKCSLWMPFFMHAFMNLWWEVFAMGNSALGGVGANVARVLTALIVIGWTFKATEPLRKIKE